MKDINQLPPLHPNCACVPMFFDSKSEAEKWSGMISDSIDKKVNVIENNGLMVKEDGTGVKKV
jgi:hypothetical protein